MKSQLRDLLILGTSNTAWGRRCEIMKFVCLAALIYTRVVSQKDASFEAAKQQLCCLLPESEGAWKRAFEQLIEELLFGDLGDCFESLAGLMRVGTELNGQSWCSIRVHLLGLYQKVHERPLQTIVDSQAQNSQDMEMAGLTALFGFFNMMES